MEGEDEGNGEMQEGGGPAFQLPRPAQYAAALAEAGESLVGKEGEASDADIGKVTRHLLDKYDRVVAEGAESSGDTLTTEVKDDVVKPAEDTQSLTEAAAELGTTARLKASAVAFARGIAERLIPRSSASRLHELRERAAADTSVSELVTKAGTAEKGVSGSEPDDTVFGVAISSATRQTILRLDHTSEAILWTINAIFVTMLVTLVLCFYCHLKAKAPTKYAAASTAIPDGSAPSAQQAAASGSGQTADNQQTSVVRTWSKEGADDLTYLASKPLGSTSDAADTEALPRKSTVPPPLRVESRVESNVESDVDDLAKPPEQRRGYLAHQPSGASET